MKREHPILFSAPMVRAILDGRKTQTRRVVKPPPSGEWCPLLGDFHETVEDSAGDVYPGQLVFGAYDDCESARCPYGRPGDRLWVRETWFSSTPKTPSRVRYAADGLIRLEDGLFARAVCKPPKWRPSIFMPRWASRITLEIVAVRVERLQCISEKDAQREGLESVSHGHLGAWKNYAFETSNPKMSETITDERHRIVGYQSAVRSFRSLWDTINSKRGFGWDLNPWVWVIEFKRVTT